MYIANMMESGFDVSRLDLKDGAHVALITALGLGARIPRACQLLRFITLRSTPVTCLLQTL